MKPLFLIQVPLLLIQLFSIAQRDAVLNQGTLGKETIQKIDGLLKEFNQNTAGYAIGILKEREVIYTKGFGAANLDHSVPVTPKTSFDIASVSKQFTAAAIA